MKKQILCFLLALIFVFALAAPLAQAGDGPACPACGRQIPADSRFCPYCGQKLAAEEGDGAVVLYHMVHYGTQEAEEPHNRMFRDYSIYGNYKKFKARPSYGEKHLTRIVTAEELEQAKRFEPGTVVRGVLEHYEGYQYGTSTAYYFGDDKYVWFVESMELIFAAQAPAPQAMPSSSLSLVTDAYTANCRIAGNDVTFRIPQINLNSVDADRINRELYDSLCPLAESRIAEAEQNSAAAVGGLDYAVFTNGDVLSLLIDCEQGGESAGHEYRVYNLSVTTGSRLGSGDLPAALGLSEAAYRALVKLALESQWHQQRTADEPGAQDALEKCLADENLDAAQPYLGAGGRLCAASMLYLPSAEPSGVLLDLGLSA